ncbi:uncharacterized protein YbjQ (UPF0145 family) [Streptomyces turgidiscabies]|uniref:UPF0145 protein QFZ49_003099 n=1 Tax=Streptomyces turgidiscabies TaxID=85558 RepID=A0ABU0RMD4_9ACTN|nr:uncharacterized protein YbjQ (UPF0145 family) [Streptomyces turgidiscabies]
MGIEEYGGGQGPQSDVLVVTTNDIPGYRVEQVIGEVFGLTVRSRHLGSQIGAGLKSMIGGELKGLTKTLVETRNQAMERLIEQARARGANGVLAFRFDVTEAADVGTEVWRVRDRGGPGPGVTPGQGAATTGPTGCAGPRSP